MSLRFLFVLLLVCPLAGSWADDLKPSEAKTRESLQGVINGQLAAFRKEDYAGAFVFADRTFKDQLSLEGFERMVKSGYPAIAHSTSARCGLTLDNGGVAVVNVRVFSEGREPVDYRYSLRRDGESWRITGVTLLQDETTSV